jgi:hypothetical protein
MNEIMDIRLQQHLAQEFYRQQMLQRIPGNQSIVQFHPKMKKCLPKISEKLIICFWRRLSVLV